MTEDGGRKGYHTIGEVVAKLREDFPTLSAGKVRYLERERLIAPARTPGGHRLFSPEDVDSLRHVLTLRGDGKYFPPGAMNERIEGGIREGAQEGEDPTGGLSRVLEGPREASGGLGALEVARAIEDPATGLTDRERLVLRRRMGPETGGPPLQRALAEELAVHPTNVSQTEARALEKVRRRLLGLPVAKRGRHGTPKKEVLDARAGKALMRFFREDPGATLGDARAWLLKERGLHVALAQMRPWLRRLGSAVYPRLLRGFRREDVRRAMADPRTGLSERERAVLSRRLGGDGSEPDGQGRIAKALSLSVNSVSKIEHRACEKTRLALLLEEAKRRTAPGSEAGGASIDPALAGRDAGGVLAVAAAVSSPLSSLSARERYVLLRRTGLDGRPPSSRREVAEAIGLPDVARVEREALSKAEREAQKIEGPPAAWSLAELEALRTEAARERTAVVPPSPDGGVPPASAPAGEGDGGQPTRAARFRSHRGRGSNVGPLADVVRAFGEGAVRRAVADPSAALTARERSVLEGRLVGVGEPVPSLTALADRMGLSVSYLWHVQRDGARKVRDFLGRDELGKNPAKEPSSASDG